MMTEISQEQIDSGQKVQAAMAVQKKYQKGMDDNKERIMGYRSKKQGYATEIEMLNSKELNFELKMRKLDLEENVSNIDIFISGLEKEQLGIQHSIDVSSLGVNTAKDEYQKIIQPAITGNLSNYDIDFLKGQMPRSKMSFADKKILVDKYGVEAVNTHIPMI